jgi:hypothetical protein
MKRKIKIVLSCVITLCFTIGMIKYMGFRLDPDASQRALDAIEAFHSLDDNSLEVIIYGSSHAWKGCDTMEMYQNYGLAAYNYGCNWQALNTTLLFLQDSLRTQTPKIVCIETRMVGTVEINKNMDGQIYYTRAIKNFAGKNDYLRQCFGSNLERYASYYMPLIMFHDNWNQVKAENFSESNPEMWISTMGYNGSDTISPGVFEDYTQFSQNSLPQHSLEILDKMVAACEEKGVQIIFYTCPYQGEYTYSEAMKEYVSEHDCTYLDLFEYLDDMGMDAETDFRDPGHLNDSGSAKVANFLGKYIVDNYDMTDMRKIEGNIWQQNITSQTK